MSDPLSSGSMSKDLYFVAVKLFLRDGDKLLITHDVWDAWDLVGGRLRREDFATPLEQVVKRKVTEELGEKVQYKLGRPIVFFRHERKEAGLDGQLVRIFAVGYEAEYLSGDIKLWQHHDKMEWVDVATFKPENYFEGGWLKGVQEYLKIAKSK